MIRRFMSTRVDKFISCNDCYRFNSVFATCSLNNDKAYNNRNAEICGNIPKNFIDKNINKKSCFTCKFYNDDSKLCNKDGYHKLAIDKRSDHLDCGPTGKFYDKLDETYLEKSYFYKFTSILAIISTFIIPCEYMFDYYPFTSKLFVATGCATSLSLYFLSLINKMKHKIEKKL